MAVDENLRFLDKDLFQRATRNLTQSRMCGGRAAMSGLASGGLVLPAADACLHQCGEHCRMSTFDAAGASCLARF